MNINQMQTNPPNRIAVKPAPAAAPGMASPKPTRQEATLPSDADIATKAYEIWLARGQEMGHDQEHWFEAKRQLQRM